MNQQDFQRIADITGDSDQDTALLRDMAVEPEDDPAKALERYCELMEDWVAAVRENGELADVYPVAAEPTVENAELLERRVAFFDCCFSATTVAGACFGATKTHVVSFSPERALEPMAIPGTCGNGHLVTPDNLKVDQAKRRWRCGRARAAEFRTRHQLGA